MTQVAKNSGHAHLAVEGRVAVAEAAHLVERFDHGPFQLLLGLFVREPVAVQAPGTLPLHPLPPRCCSSDQAGGLCICRRTTSRSGSGPHMCISGLLRYVCLL